LNKIVKKPDKKDSNIIFDEILSFIDKKEVLFIIDDCEEALKEDKNSFKELIEEIMTRCPKVKIMFTSKI
jgi:predicted nucleic acid-binding protein